MSARTEKMAYKIVITGQAKEDTQTAYDYYEEQRQDLDTPNIIVT